MNGSLRHRRRASVCATASSTVRAPPPSCQSTGRAAVPASDCGELADSRKQPLRDIAERLFRDAALRSRGGPSSTICALGPDGVPPGGVRDQDTGIRRPGTVAAPDRLSNSLYPHASWTDAPTQIAMGLEPERAALDPLHHVVGHDLDPGSRRTNTQRPGGRCPAPAPGSARSARIAATSRLGRFPGSTPGSSGSAGRWHAWGIPPFRRGRQRPRRTASARCRY
jgi:hypothetical protein